MGVFGSGGQSGQGVLSAKMIINRSLPGRDGRKSLKAELKFSVRSRSCLAQGTEGRATGNKGNRDVN